MRYAIKTVVEVVRIFCMIEQKFDKRNVFV